MCSFLEAFNHEDSYYRNPVTGGAPDEGLAYHLRAFSCLKVLGIRGTRRRMTQMPSIVLAVVPGPPLPSLLDGEFSDIWRRGFIVPSNAENIEGFDGPQNYKYEGRVVHRQDINYVEIQKWLSECQEQHGEGCNPKAKSYDFNAKVFDCYSSKLEPRTLPMTEGTEYFALSYVRGLPDETELPDAPNGQHSSSFPKTIEDAMNVAKRLGKRYL